MNQAGETDLTRGLRAEMPAPAPSAALQMAVASMEPVSTRVPGREFAALLAVSLLISGIVVATLGIRPDAGSLPTSWLLGVGFAWMLAGPFLLARAVLPRPGTVLPDAGRAGRSAVLVALGLLLLGLLGTPPGENRVPASFLSGLFHCGKVALGITLPILIAGTLVVRQLPVVGVAKLAAAFGAAGGAWAGVTLHTVCPLGGALHVGFAHGGAALVGAGIGALLVRAVLR